jgi:hypothetical protein
MTLQSGAITAKISGALTPKSDNIAGADIDNATSRFSCRNFYFA